MFQTNALIMELLKNRYGAGKLKDLDCDIRKVFKVPLGIVTDLIKTLIGNGSVNTFQHATIQGNICFL
jgi:hypothetical protein